MKHDTSKWTGAVPGLLAFVTMLAIAAACAVPMLSDWDSWDYAAQAMTGQSSDLALGRWWFIAVMRAAYLLGKGLFGLTVLQGHWPMQVASALMAAAAVPLGMAWTCRLTGSRLAKALFAVLVIAAPLVAVYASSVMTESMSFLTLMICLYSWQRACGPAPSPRAAGMTAPLWAILSGVLFGIVVDIREPLVLLAPWFAVCGLLYGPANRWRLLLVWAAAAAVALGVGVAGAAAWNPKGSYWASLAQWGQWMDQHRQALGLSVPQNVRFLCEDMFISAPGVALLAIPATLWAAVRNRRLLTLWLCVLPYVAWMLFNHDFPSVPRYVLVLPFFVGPVVAAAMADLYTLLAGRNRALAAAAAAALAGGVILLAWGVATVRADYYQAYYYSHARDRNAVCRALLELPDACTVAPGEGTAAAFFLNRLQLRHFAIIRHGWEWPTDLPGQLAREFAAGRRVFVDVEPSHWSGQDHPGGELDQLTHAMAQCRTRPAPRPLVELLPRVETHKD